MRIFILRLCLVLMVCYIPMHGHAQANDALTGYGFEVNMFAGRVIKHSPKFHLPLPDRSTGFDVNMVYKCSGRKPWEVCRKYPTIGLAVAYTNYGIDSVYGRCFSIYPNLVIPIITSKHFEWTIRIGDGMGYVTKKYGRNPISDTLNNAIGSHINDYASFMTDLRYIANEHWDIQAGMNFSHISDASYHQPNLGINLYGAHIGVRYFPVSSKPKHTVCKSTPLRDRWLVQTRLGIAFNQIEAPRGPTFPVYLATLYTSKRWHEKNKAYFGVDYSYYESIYTYQRTHEINPGHEAEHSYKAALLAGNEFLFGRVGIILQVGYYIVGSEMRMDKYYEKIGGHYYIVQKEKGPIKELYLTGFLKTHKTIAELAEFGLGFGF